MNPDKPKNSEQELFDELLGRIQLDDSVNEQHQSDLRARVLQAFDRSHFDARDAVPVVAKNRNAAQVFGVVAATAACIFVIVSIQLTKDRCSVSRPVAEIRSSSNETIDPVFIATLAEVDALREELPSELFFEALEICQQKHELNKLDSEANQMRLFYETSLLQLHFRGTCITEGLILRRKRPFGKLDVVTPNQFPKGQGWQIVNVGAAPHKLNMVRSRSRLGTTNDSV